MPPPGWLHVNGVSLSTDTNHQAVQISDSRTKHMTSPIAPTSPPLTSQQDPVPFTAVTNDRQYSHRHYSKIENVDLPKRLFIDRQIKKVKSLSGLIKGTAVSRSVSLHSAPNSNPTGSNPSINNSNEDSSPIGPMDNNENYESHSTNQQADSTNETRRPRVSFSNCNKVQFFEDTNEDSQPSTRRRHRQRTSKKSNPLIASSYVSTPSIQQTQTLLPANRPLSRQQQSMIQELNIKKQLIFPSPRVQSSRATHLPDLHNQSLPNELPSNEKQPTQRDKSLPRLSDSIYEKALHSSVDASRETSRGGGATRCSTLQDYNDQNQKPETCDSVINTSFLSGSMSISSGSRPRPFRSISLRHQFTSPVRPKATNIANANQSIINPRQSTSFKLPNSSLHLIDDDHDDIHANGFILSTIDSRNTTRVNSSRQLKRNYVIHLNSKSPFNGNITNDNLETNRHSNKSSFHESSQERFHNVLKIGRPPYVTGIGYNNQNTALTTPVTTNTANGSVRSSHTNSRRGSRELPMTSNTIYV